MKRLLIAAVALQSFFIASLASAEAEYVTIEMEIDIDRSAEKVWELVGEDYCAISDWFGFDCEITSGDGEMGTVRALAGGRILEILVAKTELSYGYTQPVQEGEFYNLYHGFMEARPITNNSSKMIYTLVYDVSNMEDQAAKDEDVARRRAAFEGALINMKELAEGA